MTDTTIYKAALETQLAEIIAELKTIGVYDEVSDNWEAVPDTSEVVETADQNATADFTEEWNERQATLFALEREYQDIKRALAKIATATFGVCEICGTAIEERRLEARPDARTCTQHMNEEGVLSL